MSNDFNNGYKWKNEYSQFDNQWQGNSPSGQNFNSAKSASNASNGRSFNSAPYVQSASHILSGIIAAKAARNQQRRAATTRAFDRIGDAHEQGNYKMSDVIGRNNQLIAQLLG